MATKQNSTSILGDINPPKAIIKLALPATLALLAKAVYNIVDTAYIGMLDTVCPGESPHPALRLYGHLCGQQ